MWIGTEDEAIVARILRVNDAGERGGVTMYTTQIAVAGRRWPELLPFLERTRDHEADHARRFRALMPSRGAKPCRLPWIWKMGGMSLGVVTAILGPRAVYLCTEVVERSVHKHLHDQLQWLESRDRELADLVRSVAADEMEHWEHAARMRANAPAPFARILDRVIAWTTESLMWLSTRGDSARLARVLAP
jgi:ubiquinone biosynthesis monooxygenase Coq7